MAAKSVINMVREINPMLLEKKFRGKYMGSADKEERVINKVASRIDGVQLLEQTGTIPI